VNNGDTIGLKQDIMNLDFCAKQQNFISDGSRDKWGQKFSFDRKRLGERYEIGHWHFWDIIEAGKQYNPAKIDCDIYHR
jgi:hypothetical protein